MLSGYRLQIWVLLGDYQDGSYDGGFINANRPGICSCAGYISLYFAGMQVGQWLFQQRSSWDSHIKLLRNLLVVVVVTWLLTLLSHVVVGASSRMLANVTFVLWQVCHNVLLLSYSYVVDIVLVLVSRGKEELALAGQCKNCIGRRKLVTQKESDSLEDKIEETCCCLTSCVCTNQLFFFLLGNIMTGLVNMSVKTGSAGVLGGLGVMMVYVGLTTGVITLMFTRNVNTKFW